MYCCSLLIGLETCLSSVKFKYIILYIQAIYFFLKLLKFTYCSIKPIEKLSRRHFINSFDYSDL